VQPYLADAFDPVNARAVRDQSFVLYLNENYGEREAGDVTAAIVKVERHYGR
jgi:perosamine synthetase